MKRDSLNSNDFHHLKNQRNLVYIGRIPSRSLRNKRKRSMRNDLCQFSKQAFCAHPIKMFSSDLVFLLDQMTGKLIYYWKIEELFSLPKWQWKRPISIHLKLSVYLISIHNLNLKHHCSFAFTVIFYRSRAILYTYV